MSKFVDLLDDPKTDAQDNATQPADTTATTTATTTAVTKSDEPTATSNDAKTQATTATTTTATQESPKKKEHNVGEEKETQELRKKMENVFIHREFDVSVERADPKSPLYAAIEFEDVGKSEGVMPISKEVLAGARKMGYEKPSKIQSVALPLLLKNPPENLIFQSQAGTGKTAAFAMNVLTRIKIDRKFPQAVYVANTFQLCYQTKGVIESLGQCIEGLDVGLLFGVGDRSQQDNEQQVVENIGASRGDAKCHIVCSTVQKLADTLKRGRKFNGKDVNMFVVDEADELLMDPKNYDALKSICRCFRGDVQVILLSATFEDHVLDFAKKIARDANVITIPIEDVVRDNVKQVYLKAPEDYHKRQALVAIYDTLGTDQAIVFCRTRNTAIELEKFLKDEEGHEVCLLIGGKADRGGGMSKQEQIRQLQAFIDGKSNILITTDILSRGIDIKGVNLVVNYDFPSLVRDGRLVPLKTTYVHRIGRTGRFGRTGTAITFVANNDEWDMLASISATYDFTIDEIETNNEFEINEDALRQKVDEKKA